MAREEEEGESSKIPITELYAPRQEDWEAWSIPSGSVYMAREEEGESSTIPIVDVYMAREEGESPTIPFIQGLAAHHTNFTKSEVSILAAEVVGQETIARLKTCLEVFISEVGLGQMMAKTTKYALLDVVDPSSPADASAPGVTWRGFAGQKVTRGATLG